MGFRLANVNSRAVLVADDHYFDCETASERKVASDLMAAIANPDELRKLAARLDRTAPTGRLDETALGPPVPRPGNSFGIGLNYATHVEEASMQPPAHPLVFTKFPSCLVGPTADIELRSDACDYEGELVVVIGTGGKDISVDDAWHHVAGLTVGQDISDRAQQFVADPPHFDLGKSFDTFGPIGPTLVSLDALDGDPADLRIVTDVNGEVRQDDTTANMIFDVPTLIAYLSGITTLTTGDIIFTGTPSGVGATQGKFLVDGDVITTTIDGIGTLVNRCRRVSDRPEPTSVDADADPGDARVHLA